MFQKLYILSYKIDEPFIKGEIEKCKDEIVEAMGAIMDGRVTELTPAVRTNLAKTLNATIKTLKAYKTHLSDEEFQNKKESIETLEKLSAKFSKDSEKKNLKKAFRTMKFKGAGGIDDWKNQRKKGGA